MRKLYHKFSDLELLLAIRQDDIRAYNALFERYTSRLFLHAKCHMKDGMVAEELVMDLLFNIWQKRKDLIITENVRAYLYRSLHNRMINHLHKNTLGTEPIELIPEEELMDTIQADHRLMTEDLEHAYQRKLEELSPQRRQVYLLSREQHLTYKEIAQAMNLSVNTVENHMTAVLNKLRESTRELLTTLIIFLSIFLS